MSKKAETKKLKKLEIKKETITDLSVQNPDQIKGGTVGSARPHCPTVIAPSPGGRPYTAGCPTVV